MSDIRDPAGETASTWRHGASLRAEGLEKRAHAAFQAAELEILPRRRELLLQSAYQLERMAAAERRIAEAMPQRF